MKNTKKKLDSQSRVVKATFTGSNITKYSGLNTVAKFMNRQNRFVATQEGAAKGFNTTKKGARSYHPLLVFVSEMKLLYHTWFRTGSAYTSNVIVDFLKEVKASLPATIKKVFFRADSGFFSGNLFD